MFEAIGDAAGQAWDGGWWYLTAFGVAVLVIGVAKSGFGGGIGILAVPLVASAVPAGRALGFMLPILIAADLVAVWLHRKEADWRLLRPALAGAVVGIAVGTGVMWLFKERGDLETGLSLVVGTVCLGFVGLQLYRMAGGRLPRMPHTRGTGAGAGGFAGGVSTLSHAAGPIMSVFWLEQRPDKAKLVGTLVMFFFLVNTAKLPTYLLLPLGEAGRPLINPATLLENVVWLPLVPVGSLLGLWLHRVVAERPFVLIMYAGAAAAAGHLIYEAVG
jgi:uncharacterized membrane protein YfcA